VRRQVYYREYEVTVQSDDRIALHPHEADPDSTAN